MNFRPFQDSDLPALQRIHDEKAFEFLFPQLSACWVVTDEFDRPIAAVGVEKLAQLYLYVGKIEHPAITQFCLRIFHERLPAILREQGYVSAEAFIPPSLAKKFGRRLERVFGWTKNEWASWTWRL